MVEKTHGNSFWFLSLFAIPVLSGPFRAGPSGSPSLRSRCESCPTPTKICGKPGGGGPGCIAAHETICCVNIYIFDLNNPTDEGIDWSWIIFGWHILDVTSRIGFRVEVHPFICQQMWKEDERDDDDADTEVLALQAWSNDIAGDPLKEWFYRVYTMYVCIYTHNIAISF